MWRKIGDESSTHIINVTSLELSQNTSTHKNGFNLQERIHQRIIVEIPIPRKQEQLVEGFVACPQECISERIVEQMVEVLAPWISEATVEVVQRVLQECNQQRVVEDISSFLMLHAFEVPRRGGKETVEVKLKLTVGDPCIRAGWSTSWRGWSNRSLMCHCAMCTFRES